MHFYKQYKKQIQVKNAQASIIPIGKKLKNLIKISRQGFHLKLEKNPKMKKEFLALIEKQNKTYEKEFEDLRQKFEKDTEKKLYSFCQKNNILKYENL